MENPYDAEHPVRIAKFNRVRSLTIFVDTNHGADETRINYSECAVSIAAARFPQFSEVVVPVPKVFIANVSFLVPCSRPSPD